MKFLKCFIIAICTSCIFSVSNIYAQQTGTVKGKVYDTNNKPLAGVNVIIQNTQNGATTKADGSFSIKKVSAGQKTLVFSFIGFEKVTRSITVKNNEPTKLRVTLSSKTTMLEGIQVSALQPDQLAESSLDKANIREANPQDSGELLRNVGGVNAVRRGPIGLDPVVRGLRETEVGAYVDGTRTFPAGPARMDSPISHIDPSTIESVEIVKGPYALTWGAGNMAGVKIETQSVANLPYSFAGKVSSSYKSNTNSIKEGLRLRGNTGKFGYSLSGTYRSGNDYTDGRGNNIPGDFRSADIHSKVGYALSPNSFLDFSFGYQKQKDIDYSGRLLDASFLETYKYNLHWKWNPDNSIISQMEATAYLNNIDHGMNNDAKPTAQPDPNRMPPFAIDVGVDTKSNTSGGNFSATLQPSNNLKIKAGADVYRSDRNASRTVRRRDNQMQLFYDIIWPNAVITDAGIYTKLSYRFSEKLDISGTLRADYVHSKGDSVSTFFADNVGGDLRNNETNLSASFTTSFTPSEHWTLGAGLGSVVRTADALERYSDRFPASKSQTSAEFMGNPQLDSERSTQADLWLNTQYSRWNLTANLFARDMHDYITLKPTNLPKRLPLSPNTVYQYVNGEAQFWGFDVSATYRFIPSLSLKGGVSYLWGKDKTLDEPALGVTPLRVNTGLRYESRQDPFFAEATMQIVDEQDRVAAKRGETSTGGYTTLDFKTGTTLWNRVSLQGGIRNITDQYYVNHLNAKNPYTSQQIPEVGRVFHIDVALQF